MRAEHSFRTRSLVGDGPLGEQELLERFRREPSELGEVRSFGIRKSKNAGGVGIPA
jgi:hypothetical protein